MIRLDTEIADLLKIQLHIRGSRCPFLSGIRGFLLLSGSRIIFPL